MNREIKFRAWVPKQKGLMAYYNKLKDKVEKMYYGIDSRGLVEAGYDQRDGTSWFDDVIVMQYTGLKDKTIWSDLTKEEKDKWQENNGINSWKGREIYEGDVLRGHSPNDDYDEDNDNWDCDGFKTEVKFEDGAFGVDACTGDFDRTAIGWAEDAGFIYEVIGNIYENPELLTKE